MSRHDLRSTAQYLWSLQDIIGTGATASVYKARNKKTGDVVAVKCFNELSYVRPAAVRQRELEVVRRLDHRNVVKLLAIEKDKNAFDVIVMELCAGSLYTLLDEPINAFGVSEKEFLAVFRDVTEGMNYLRVMNIVHRDIKPGNIMRAVEDGQSVYKLADFGAARELDEQEQFVSLYGTEEYLHPDMYERAVLRRQLGQTFTASVDLWSLGVTFYHTATGQLPFKPYGGRRNRETMHVITTQKASGVISGVQKTEGGNIDWSRELPKTTRLSQGLRELITPTLAGLLECKPESMWSFEDFYERAQEVGKMAVIHVFLVPAVKMYFVYISINSNFAHFQDAIAVQTEIGAGNQELVFEHEVFSPDPLQPCSEYPRTSPDNPMFLYRQDVKEFTNWFSRPLPKLPKMLSAYSLDGDYTMAKNCAGVMHYLLREQETLISFQDSIQAAVSNYRSVAKSEYQKLRCYHAQLQSSICSLEQSLLAMKTFVDLSTLSLLCNKSDPEHSALLRDCRSLEGTHYQYQQAAAELRESSRNISKQLDNLETQLIIKDNLVKKWDPKGKFCNKTVCTKKLGSLVDVVQAIYVQFRKEKNMKQLGYNEEQIHKFEKLKLSLKCTQGLSTVQDECEDNLRKLHTQQSSWHSLALEYRRQMLLAEHDTSRHMNACQSLGVTVHKFEDEYKALKSRVGQTVATLSATLLAPLYASLALTPDPTASAATAAAPPTGDPEETATSHRSISKFVEEMHAKTKIRVPSDLQVEMRIWGRRVKEMHEDLEDSTNKLKQYANMIKEAQRPSDDDMALD